MLAGSTLALAAGGSLMQAAYLGTAAAAIEIEQLGNIPLDLTMLNRWLTSRVELGDRRVSRTPPAKGEGLTVVTQERRVGQQRVRLPIVTQVQPLNTVPSPIRGQRAVDPSVIPSTHDA